MMANGGETDLTDRISRHLPDVPFYPFPIRWDSRSNHDFILRKSSIDLIRTIRLHPLNPCNLLELNRIPNCLPGVWGKWSAAVRIGSR